MTFIAHLIYWPIRILWLLMCAAAIACVAIFCFYLLWSACLWCWGNAKDHWLAIALAVALVTCGALITASYEWAKRKLAKK